MEGKMMNKQQYYYHLEQENLELKEELKKVKAEWEADTLKFLEAFVNKKKENKQLKADIQKLLIKLENTEEERNELYDMCDSDTQEQYHKNIKEMRMYKYDMSDSDSEEEENAIPAEAAGAAEPDKIFDMSDSDSEGGPWDLVLSKPAGAAGPAEPKEEEQEVEEYRPWFAVLNVPMPPNLDIEPVFEDSIETK